MKNLRLVQNKKPPIRIICVRTGTKYNQWWENNLKYMVNNYSGLKYDEFVVVKENLYELQVANKLIMFDRYRDGQNIYFDLDIVIKDDCNKFLTNDLTVCHAWWREAWHTPLNSSIISWSGDRSDVFKKWNEDLDYNMVKYHKGIDQYFYEDIKPNTYKKGFCSYQTEQKDLSEYSIVLFNQRKNEMLQETWCKKYIME